MLAALNRPKVGPLLLVRFVIMLAFAMFQSVFALFAQAKLHLSSQSTGFVLTYVGLYSVLIQSVGISLLTKRFKENTIIIVSLWLMFIGLVGWALTPEFTGHAAGHPAAHGRWMDREYDHHQCHYQSRGT